MADDKNSQKIDPIRLYFVWGALIFVLVGITFALFQQEKAKRAAADSNSLRIYRQLPEFEFTERTGKPFGLKDLKGKIWVSDFIFTRCGGPCPLMSAAMAKLQKLLGENEMVKLVTFTVDPQHDTPAVLTEYAKRYGARDGQWFFLTGDETKLRKFIGESFKLVAQKNMDQTPGDDSEAVLHSTHFVLVDQKGQIRGYYDSSQPETLQKVLDAAQVLASEK